MTSAPLPAAVAVTPLQRAVGKVAALNLGYFGIEMGAALAIGSVALFADGVDFLEDASVNFLIFVALAWTARRRAHVGQALAAILLLPVAAFVWALWSKLQDPVPPEPLPLTVVGVGALAVNLACTLLLAKHRGSGGSLAKAAFLSARNDVLANTAIIAAGLLTVARPSIWPDIVVGVGIAIMNLGAAKEVWETAKAETEALLPLP